MAGRALMGCARWLRGARRARLAVPIALALSLLACSPALALVQQGHEYDTSIGSQGSGDGQFLNPTSVAVSEVGKDAGDFYVVDKGNNRIEQFNANHEFVAAWGFGVKNGAKEYQVCKGGCQAGLPDPLSETFHVSPGQLASPGAIAVDNSTSPADPSAGDVYVVADEVKEKSYVYKFTADGEYVGHLTKKAETEEYGYPVGVAVDPAGQVWVAWREGGHVTQFGNAEKNKRVGEEGYGPEDSGELQPGFAVNSKDDLYLNFEPLRSEAFSEQDQGEHGEEPCEVAAPCYTAKIATSEEGERPVELGEAFIDELFGETSTGVAVDLANDDVYVDHGSEVSAFTADGSFVQRFGAGHMSGGRGLSVDAATGEVLVASSAADTVAFFKLAQAEPPSVEELSAKKVTTGSAELLALVSPAGGSEPSATFEYGAGSCAGGGCATAPASALSEGHEDEPVLASIHGLAPNTTYHYRVVVTTRTSSVASREGEFSTASFALPDERAWEMVSPAAKNGAGLEGLTNEGGLIEASEDGNALTYLASSPIEASTEGNRNPAFTQILAKRSSAGWSSHDIAIPGPEHPAGVSPGEQQEYLWFSPDLSVSLIEPHGLYPKPEPVLSNEATEKTIYIRQDEGCAAPPSSCYLPLVTAANDTAGTKFGGAEGVPLTGIHFLDATPDLSHVILSSEVPLNSEPAAAKQNLYEWSAGKPPAEQLKLVNVLPSSAGGGPAASPELGHGHIHRNAISSDGARVFFSAGRHLYMRDMETGETTQIDAPEEAGLGAVGSVEEAIYQGASSDGSEVYFTDEQRLTKSSTAAGISGDEDLYARNTTTGVLSDLSATAGGAAGVHGYIEIAEEGGTTVAFVADAALGEAANVQGEKPSAGACLETEREKVPGTGCNLYVERAGGTSWEPPTFVGRLSNQDQPDWGSTIRGDLGAVTMRFSPNGRFLAFMSQRPLTGYENRDANTKAEGARAEEVYIYDGGVEASTPESLRCVSCDPNADRPTGLFDTEESGEGLGPLVDRSGLSRGTFEQQWIAGSLPGYTRIEGQEALYQSRYLSNSGRLFFDSPEALVPADENGKEDVYEYEPEGVGSCHAAGCISLVSSGTSSRESAFLDASTNGNDVFFLTAAPLVPSDNDTSFDVYDARVCSAESPCVNAPVTSTENCESSEACNKSVTSVPVYSPPASSTPSGSGNLPARTQVLPSKSTVKPKPTRAQLLAKALKSCKKLKQKSRRIVCERTARKKYGPRKVKKAVKR